MFVGPTAKNHVDQKQLRKLLKTSKMITVFLFSGDINYLELNPQFNELTLIDQLLINATNRSFRGRKFELNNCLESSN